MENGKLLYNFQFGVRHQTKKHCEGFTVLHTSKVYEGFELKQSTAATMIYYDAAFNRIPHSSVVLQPTKMGIRDKLLEFIVKYLRNLLIEVSVNEVH